MDTKKAVLKGVLTMVVVALAGFLLFNGIGRHPYQPDELEGVFRKEAAARSVSGEGEVISETYGNSITFAMQTADGKRACATYGRSMFFDKYKELEFYTGVQGEEPAENIVYAERNDTITGDSITYSVNDGAIAYQATVRFGNDIGIQFSDEVRPMMYLMWIAVCLAAQSLGGCVSSLADGRHEYKRK